MKGTKTSAFLEKNQSIAVKQVTATIAKFAMAKEAAEVGCWTGAVVALGDGVGDSEGVAVDDSRAWQSATK